MSNENQLDIAQLNGINASKPFLIDINQEERAPQSARSVCNPDHIFRKDVVRIILHGLRRGQPVSLVGPKGCGKTSEVIELLERLNRNYIYMQASEGLEIEDLFGYDKFVADGSMTQAFHEGPVLTAMRKGWPLVLDERDSLSDRVALTLNAVLDGMGYTIPSTGEHVRPEDGFVVIGASNTNGAEADDVYVTSNVASASTNSRYLVMFVDHLPSAEMERLIHAISQEERDQDYDQDQARCLIQVVEATRHAEAEEGFSNLALGTRELGQMIRYEFDTGSLAQGAKVAYFNKLTSALCDKAQALWDLSFGMADEDDS